MSKYLCYESVVFVDRQLLLAALADLGHTEVEEGKALALYGYQGDRRPETAELIVRRQHLGSASNDLGFRQTDRGFVPVISEYDQRALLGGRFLPRLRTAYAEHVVETVRKRLRGSVHRATEASVIKLRVRY